MFIILITLVIILLFCVGLGIFLYTQIKRLQHQQRATDPLTKLTIQLEESMRTLQHGQIQLQTTLSEHLMKSFDALRGQILETLNQGSQHANQQMEKLTEQTTRHLQNISHQVEKRLSEGFEKTTATFQDVVKRLALIDVAQKKITELSNNVMSLQEILADKRSRGAFGEVQLTALVRNILPENSFAFQYTFSSGKRADCILFLPKPTGHIVVDAKFPLENYRHMTDLTLGAHDRQSAQQKFKKDVQTHIKDIASKYIIEGETSDGAIMFIPAEAIFAEIHGHHPDLVELAQRYKVWITSPTTLMAILTTVRAVLKDDATREQVHIIQKHLSVLSKDFGRFQSRINNLSKHIKQVHDDIDNVHTSASKITSRFTKIETVDLEEIDAHTLE
ncbi:MAG: DNA recombination protein RmuC [Gammaproteobacteria bacterium]|nr:DNA recombination protein RmuC [Gammaproteobacteria bacterium]